MHKNFFSIFFLSSSLFISNQLALFGTEENSYQVVEDLGKEKILTPSFQSRNVLKIKLKNGLEAVLISDPTIDESAAVLTVKTGSFNDGEENSGIAHFLEHMLFLGTKKYPEEDGYQRFIKENGGFTNAFTSNDYTAYLFTVNHNAFKEALDRFSEFFKEPLFNPSGVSRELNAIDQEYAKNVQDDMIRTIYVMKEISNPKHPYHQFGMGNKEALSNVSQKTLIDWYEKNYSANLMRLMVYSNLPLDELKNLVVQDFSGIRNKEIIALKTPKEPIRIDDGTPKIYTIEPVKHLKNLVLAWNLPEKFANSLETQPETYVCHVLGDEGEKSLLQDLKDNKLAESLGCTSFKIGPGNQIFFIDIDLTDEGLKSVDKVIEKVFQTIALLKQSTIPPYIFEEVQQIGKIKYQFQTRSHLFETIMKEAMKLPFENLETFPVHSMIVQKFDPSLIRELIDFLTPENTDYFLIAPSKLTGIKPTKEEKWLHVQYGTMPISESTFKEWKQAKPSSEIDLPLRNHFIPKNLSLFQKIEEKKSDHIQIPKPKQILNSEEGSVYFATDTLYGVPEIYFYFEIKTPEIQSGHAISVVLADLYIKTLKDNLSQFSYPAQIAGLQYDISRTDNGIGITISGYNDNSALLLEKIANELLSVSISEEKFAIFKESLYREYENAYKSSPLKAASDTLKSALYKYNTNEIQKEVAIKSVTYEMFKNKIPTLFQKRYIEGLIYGNIIEQQANDIISTLLKALPGKNYPKSEQQKKEVLVLPADKGPFYIEKQVNVQGNAIILVVEEADYSDKKRAAQQILMQAMSSPFFSDLRTKQQTGYLVDSSDQEIEKHLFNLFVIQSNTHDVHALLSRIELFIESYMQELGQSNLTLENFNTIKESLIHNLEHTYNNTASMGELLKNLAFKYDGDFEWIAKRIKAFHELSYEEFLNIANQMFKKSNKRRLAIMIDGLIPKDSSLQYIKLQTMKELRKLSHYSSGNCCDFYPDKVR